MTSEGFLDKIRRMDARLKQAEQIGEAFLKQLTEALVEHAYNWYPKWQHNREATEKEVTELAAEFAGETMQLYGALYYQCKRGEPLPPETKFGIPKLRSREASETKLQKMMADIPAEHHEFLEKLYWEDFERRQHSEKFRFEAHWIMKKALTDHYGNEILELEADYFRKLESFIYYLSAAIFVEKCYEIMK